jgi:hypothetical protein
VIAQAERDPQARAGVAEEPIGPAQPSRDFKGMLLQHGGRLRIGSADSR